MGQQSAAVPSEDSSLYTRSGGSKFLNSRHFWAQTALRVLANSEKIQLGYLPCLKLEALRSC